MAQAATNVDLVVDDFDIIDDFDAIQGDLDLDLLADDDDREFRCAGAYYSAIFSDSDIVSHCRHGCEDGDGDDSGAAAACGWLQAGLGDDDCADGAGEEEEEEAGSSPADSGVTDGPLTPAAEAMSAYVAELERFLLDDDDETCCEQAEVDQSLLGVIDDYFAGDQLLASTGTAEVVLEAGRAGPNDGEEEQNGDVLAAREDEQSASRKRARNKIKGRTAMLAPWGELEGMNLTMTHLAQKIQVPAAPWPQALLLCCM